MSGQPPPRGWGRPSPSPVPFRPASPYGPSPPPILSARRLPGSPMSPMPPPMSPMFGCPSPARLPPRLAGPGGAPYIPCPRPRWPSPLPQGMPLPGPRPYRFTPVQSPSPPVMCASPEYFYSPSPYLDQTEYMGVPLEPPGPPLDDDEAAAQASGLSTAAIIASQSQDYVDEKLAEYQATIHQLQGKSPVANSSR